MSIDIDDYLNNVVIDCGTDLQYDADFVALEQAIKGKAEQQIGDVLQEAEPPNWREVKKSAEALLTRTTDLRILVFYLRALMATESYQGLKQGLMLLNAVVQQRWDKLHPQLDPDDDNDPIERINILTALSDYDTLLRPLSQLTFLESKALGKFSLRDVLIATGKSTATKTEKVVPASTIDAAVQDSEAEFINQHFLAVSDSLEALNRLENYVTEQVGVGNSASFSELRSLLKEALAVLTEWQHAKGIGQEEIAEVIDDLQEDTAPVAKTPATAVLAAINNQQDVIKALNLIIDYYKKHEPSSPVPMFLERARGLVGKNFMEVLEDIAPQGIDQAKVFKGKQEE